MKPAISLVCLFLLLASCKEDPPKEELPDPAMPGIPFTGLQNSDATLQATYSSILVDSGVIGTLTYFQGVAQAVFYNAARQNISPKKIVAEGAILNPKNGIFTNEPGETQGLDFGSITEWQVEGRNTIPSFTEGIMDRVPEIGDVNVKDSLDSSQPMKLIIDFQNPFTRIGIPDSINYLIKGGAAKLVDKGNTPDTVFFSPTDLQTLGLGKAFIQVEAFRIEEKDYSGFRVSFVNKGVFTKEVWVY